jgi:hypothetical protein
MKISDRRSTGSLSLCATILTHLVLLIASCSVPPAPPSPLVSRLSPEWIGAAQRVRSGDRTIYYHGRANGAAPPNGGRWIGSLNGDILVLDAGMAIVVPAGTLTLTPGGGLKVTGQQHIITSDAPAWKHLLLP